MASRVNTRFVILLVVGIVGLLGMMLVAYSVAFKSAADNMREGDRLLAEGNIKQAERAYSKGVNKDTTNVEYLNKWIQSLEMLVPETETEYRDRFYTDYSGAISKAATVLRNDVDAHERQLELMYKQLRSEYSRGLADRMIEQTTSSLGFYSSGDGSVQPWERLRRYRGIAITQISMRGGVLEDNSVELAKEDLQRALEVDPTDSDSRIALMTLDLTEVDRNAPRDDRAARINALRENLAEADSYLASYPEDQRMRLQRLFLLIELDRRSLDQSQPPEQQVEQLKELYVPRIVTLNDIAESLQSGSSDQLNIQTLTLFAGIENTIDPPAQYVRSRELLNKMVSDNPESAEYLYYAGQLAKDANATDDANKWFEQIQTLQVKPLSYEGLRQFSIQRLALLRRAEIAVEQAEVAVDETARAAAVAKAIQLRDQFSGMVSEDNLAQVLLDGRIALAQDKTDESLRLFKKYNDQTQRSSPAGLWYEGQVAKQLGQFGVARDALMQLIAIDNSNRKIAAMISLAQIEEQLQNLETAASYYRDVLEVRPTMQEVQGELDRVNMLLNPELNDDPALAAIYTSRRLRLGDNDTTSDYAGAVEYLREAVERLEYEPRVARELASLMLDSGDIDGARVLIQESARRYPDDEALSGMLRAMESGNTDEILVSLIRESDRPELEKLISIAGVASNRGMYDLLDETVAQLNSIAPDDRRVLEFTFANALRKGDTEQAIQISKRPELTQVESISYQARIAVAQKQQDRAIELLNQAASSGTADVAIYQLLAMLQREKGDMSDSINSFKQALAIRPDNSEVIREYLLTLTQMREYDQALNEARRMQRYGTVDPVFMNLWLTLESQFGGVQGRDFATRQRERLLELNPNDPNNAYQLARLYILSGKWNESRVIIDQLRSTNDSLEFAELEATWYAEQGMVDNKDGLVLANEVFKSYIESIPGTVGPEPYVLNSQFMLSRGRPDLALVAANEAVEHQSPETMEGSVLLGDLYMRINNFSDAVKAYRSVVDAGADDEQNTVRSRLVDSLVRLDRYEEAQEVYNGFPPSQSNDMITMLQGADIAKGMGNDQRAREILNNTVSAYPNNPLVFIKRAEMMIGDETLANDMLSDLGRAMELEPNNWRAYRVRAAGYFNLGRRDDALEDLKTTIKLNPSLDRSIYAVLNELLAQPGRTSEAAGVARDIISMRSDDANLMARIGGLFASRKEWNYASEFYGMAWEKRHAPSDGATYIDTLVRQSPPDANKANDVINQLAAMVGDINTNSGLLAAQALVLQARGRDDFAQQQITKAFDLSVTNNIELMNWANNIARYFEDRPATEHIAYLETLKRRNSNPVIGQWLDFFIAQRLTREDTVPQRAFDMLIAMQDSSYPAAISTRSYRLHGTTLFSQKKYEEAAAVWRAGLERFSDDWEMNNNLAYVLSSKLGKAQEALAYGEKGVAENIGLSEPYETMAGIYIALGKYDEAQQMIDTGSKFIKTVPARVTMLLTAGRLALKKGDRTDARSKIADARSVLRSAPESHPDLEQDIADFEQELNSEEN